MLTKIKTRTEEPDEKTRLRVTGQNMFKILDGLLAKNNGVLEPSTKQQILVGINKNKVESIFSYPKFLIKHGVTYEVFPEVWNMIYEKLETHGEEIKVT
jgi:hypothetical protein